MNKTCNSLALRNTSATEITSQSQIRSKKFHISTSKYSRGKLHTNDTTLNTANELV